MKGLRSGHDPQMPPPSWSWKLDPRVRSWEPSLSPSPAAACPPVPSSAAPRLRPAALLRPPPPPQAFTSGLRKYLQYYRACVLSTPPTLSLLTIGFLFKKLGRQLR